MLFVRLKLDRELTPYIPILFLDIDVEILPANFLSSNATIEGQWVHDSLYKEEDPMRNLHRWRQ